MGSIHLVFDDLKEFHNELEGKTDSVILVEKLIDDDGEKQNTPKEIYIEPFIQMTEE